MERDRPEWFDEAAGPLVRPYAVTGGRTRAVAPGLDLITLVLTVDADDGTSGLPPECAQILQLCRCPQSIAEISAQLNLPVVVTKVLVSDLLDRKLVVSRSPGRHQDSLDPETLQAVLHGLRRI